MGDQEEERRANPVRELTFTEEEFRTTVRTIIREVEAHRLIQQGMTDTEHKQHHEWVKDGIDAQRELRQIYKEIRVHIAKVGAISLLTILFFALYYGFKHALAKVIP